MIRINLADRNVTHDEYFVGATRTALAMLGLHSNWTGEQAPRLERIAELTGRSMGGSNEEIRNAIFGACLHDIGKNGVSRSILDKPGPLSDDERGVIMTHPALGYRVLHELGFPEDISQIALRHHEKWDGSGYPDKLKGDHIPLGAQIIAVVDSFDAMVSDRPYRKGRSYAEAATELRACSGKHFSPVVVKAFLMIKPPHLTGYEAIAWH